MKLREVLPWNWSKKEQTPATREGWSPFLARDIEDWFGELARRPFGGLGGLEPESAAFLPALDARESDREIEITIELPGLSEKDIELSVSHDHLTIQGEKQQEQTRGEEGSQWVERRFGAFRRVIPLPPDVASDEVEARFDRGVLRITLPRTGDAAARRKTIPIQTG